MNLFLMDSGKILQRKKTDGPVNGARAADRGQQQEVSTKSLDLKKVLHLLEDPLTANLKERHLFVLKKLLKRNQIGFLLKELTGIARVLNICAQKAQTHPEYLFILCEALKICRLPFLKEKASDELNYAQDVIHFLSHIGFLMGVSDAEVRHQIIDCVRSFFNTGTPKQQYEGLQSTSPGYRLQLLELSNVPQTLLLSTATVEKQPAIRQQLLKTLQILSGSSDQSCALMLEARGAETICLHMTEPDPSGQVLFLSTEILWNLLERGSKDKVTAQLSSMECVVSLKESFFHQLLHAVHPSELQLRNDLLVITTLIAENPHSLLIESLFAKQLMVLVTYPELKSHDPLLSNFKLCYSDQDLKMKKLLLNLLVLLSKDFTALQLYKEAQVMMALLTLMKPPSEPPEEQSAVHHWSSIQQEDLQLQALATLSTVAPLMLEEFMSCQGNTRLLLLLKWCTEDEAYFSEGHSFHGTGGRGSKKAQLRHCIRLLRSVTSLGEESVIQDLCDQGVINQLMSILMQMEASQDEEDVVTLEMESDIQVILSTLCEGDMHRKELFGSDGVMMTVHFLKKDPHRFHSGLGHNKLVLSTADCVWSCIVGCYTTEDYFLAKDGVFLLLDLLGSSPRCVHGIVLSTLLELCDNPNALAHVLSWRGHDGGTAPRLLLQLWRQEEEVLGVARGQHGGITDPQKPLLSVFQQETELVSNMPSLAVMEMSENLRAKIYSIFCKLGFLDLPGLSVRDYVTLGIVRRYLDFKVGEVWDEISRELVLDGIKPISVDVELLNAIQGITQETARRVMEEESCVLEQQEMENLSEEELMYTEIKSYWKQQELMVKSWDHYVSKTSNYEFMKEVKAQRTKYLESSRSKTKDKDVLVHPVQHFIGKMLPIVQGGDARAPAGVKLILTKTEIQRSGQTQEEPTTPEREHVSAVSV